MTEYTEPNWMKFSTTYWLWAPRLPRSGSYTHSLSRRFFFAHVPQIGRAPSHFVFRSRHSWHARETFCLFDGRVANVCDADGPGKAGATLDSAADVLRSIGCGVCCTGCKCVGHVVLSDIDGPCVAGVCSDNRLPIWIWFPACIGRDVEGLPEVGKGCVSCGVVQPNGTFWCHLTGNH